MLFLGMGCGPRPAANSPNVLLITFDTVRSDHFGCYGNATVETPHVDTLAKEGILFEVCVAAAPITLPSHTSILSGLYPKNHTVHLNAEHVPKKINTLAKSFHMAGYETAAFVSSFVLNSNYGLADGFDVYDDEVQADRAQSIISERRANATADRVLAWLNKPHKRPWFLWVHFFDPHQPFTPPSPWAERFSNDPYAGEIAFADDQLGRILNTVDKNHTLIIFTGDHGEDLGQHGENSHGLFTYDATLHVPLIIRLPNMEKAGMRVKDQVSLIDIAPTILHRTEIDGLPEAEGIDILTPLEKGTERHLYFETWMPFAHGWAPLCGVRTPEWKYIKAPKPELYNLVTDPGETHNVIEENSERAQALAEEVEMWQPFADMENPDSENALSSHEVRVLESLGYVGSRGKPASDFYTLPDPKDRIDCYVRFHSARAYASAGETERAEKLIRQAITECPEMLGTHDNLVQILCQAGKLDEAITEGNKLLKEDPTSLITWDLAAACNRADQPELALDYCKKGIAKHPEDASLYDQQNIAYRLLGHLKDAIVSGERAVELNNKSAQNLNNLGSTYSMAGKFKKARNNLDLALQLQPDFTEALFNRGLLALRINKPATAEKYFRAAIESDENNIDAWVELNRTLLYLNRPDEALEISYRLNQLRPGNPVNDYFMSVAYRLKADYPAAEAKLRSFLIQSPDFAPAYGELCEVLLSKEPPDMAAAAEIAQQAKVKGFSIPKETAKRMGL